MKDTLTSGNIQKGLLRFSVPIILSMLASQLYSMVDAMIIGSKLGTNALAAVSNASTVLLVFLFISGGIELGANLFIASMHSAAGPQQLTKISYNILFYDLIVSLILVGLGELFILPLLQFIHTPPEIMNEALQYARIFIGGLPLLMLYDVLRQMMIGCGDSRYPLYFVILTTSINIILDLLFVYGFHWGVMGAAFASVIAQGVGLICSFYHYYKQVLQEAFCWLDIQKQYFIELIRLAFPSTLQQMMAPISSMMKQTLLGTIGISAIAGFSAANRLTTFLLIIIYGYSQSLTIFIAQNASLKQDKRIKNGIAISYKTLMLISTLLLTTCLCFYQPLLGLFTQDPEAIHFGAILLLHEPWFYYFIAVRQVNESYLRGYKKMVAYTFCNLAVTFVNILVCYSFVPSIGFKGFYWATGISSFIGMLLGIYLVKRQKKTSALRNNPEAML